MLESRDLGFSPILAFHYLCDHEQITLSEPLFVYNLEISILLYFLGFSCEGMFLESMNYTQTEVGLFEVELDYFLAKGKAIIKSPFMSKNSPLLIETINAIYLFLPCHLKNLRNNNSNR